MAGVGTDVQALLTAAERLMQAARSDPALAQRLMDDAGATVAEAANCPLPEGLTIVAERDAESVKLRAVLADDANLPDDALELVTGGKGNVSPNRNPTRGVQRDTA